MKKYLILSIALIGVFFCSLSLASWAEFSNVSHDIDFDGDFVNEIIVESKHGAGTGHYIEQMRIYKDEFPEMKLLFSIRTVDKIWGTPKEGPLGSAIISDVEFTEQDGTNGLRDIIVKTKEVIYKDDLGTIEKEQNFFEYVFQWDGKVFVDVSKMKKIKQGGEYWGK